MATSIFMQPGTGGGTITSPIIVNPTFQGQELEADGTSGAPSKSYTSEPTMGLWRQAAGQMRLQGGFTATAGFVTPVDYAISALTGAFYWTGGAILRSLATGMLTLTNYAGTTGSTLKADALPTVASGFGGTPAVLAGSTALAGSVNVGTGGAATTGAITFGGTAFPSTPFIVVTCSAGTPATTAVATTTGATFSTSTAWPASTILNWICIGAK